MSKLEKMTSKINLFRSECFLNDEEQRRYEETVEQKIRAFNTATGDSAQPAETAHLDICLNVFKEMVGSRPRLLKVCGSVDHKITFLVTKQCQWKKFHNSRTEQNRTNSSISSINFIVEELDNW